MRVVKACRTVGRAAAAALTWLVLSAPALLAQDTTPPVLSVPFHTLEEMFSIVPYGYRLSGSGVINPTYEVDFRSYGGSFPIKKYPLRAACAGVVTFIQHQTVSKDYEILTKPSPDSIYEVIYDHVVKLKVRKGDEFQAGDILGYLGNEIQINRTDPKTFKVIAICPRDLGTPEFNRVFDDLLAIGGFRNSSVCLATGVIP